LTIIDYNISAAKVASSDLSPFFIVTCAAIGEFLNFEAA